MAAICLFRQFEASLLNLVCPCLYDTQASPLFRSSFLASPLRILFLSLDGPISRLSSCFNPQKMVDNLQSPMFSFDDVAFDNGGDCLSQLCIVLKKIVYPPSTHYYMSKLLKAFWA